MAKKEAPLEALSRYLPEGSYEHVIGYLTHYKVHLTVARERKTILGDYRHSTRNNNHRISVNGNLNKYSFLITLLHELAHLLTFEHYGHKVQAHGREWKHVFGELLKWFLEQAIFPDDIRAALQNSVNNPAASSCADEPLMRVLTRYDDPSQAKVLVEQVPEGSLFQTDDGRWFRKGARIRKRFRCEEVPGSRIYLFSPVYPIRQFREPGKA